jgi:hypothetical protein
MPTMITRISSVGCGFAIFLTAICGCSSTRTSNTSRTATEQILLSAAIDRSLSNVSFDQLRSQRVFIDDKYLDAVDKAYLMGTLRHRTLAAGGMLATNADDADVVLEARSGALGTDSEETFVGIPSIGIPGMAISIPDIKLISRNTQLGSAKIGLVAYNPKTGTAVGLGGQSSALTKNDDMYVLGMGPFRSGEVRADRESSLGYEPPSGVFANLRTSGPTGLASKKPISLVDGQAIRMAEVPTVPDSSGSGFTR